MSSILGWTTVTGKKKPDPKKIMIEEPLLPGEIRQTSLPITIPKKTGKIFPAQFKTLNESQDPYELKKAVKFFSMSLGKNIASARVITSMTRKDLAQKINVTERILADIETGKAVFDQKILNDINKVLGTKFKNI